MKSILISCLLFILDTGSSLAKDLMVYIHYGENEEISHYTELQESLYDMGLDMIEFLINRNKSIEENALCISSAINSYRKDNDSAEVIVMSDKKSSFVAIDLLSKDTSIIAWIALSGTFCDGDESLYNEASVSINTEMLDSVFFDNRKEKYLSSINKMIESAKKGKKPALPCDADDYMRNLHVLLNSRYGRSLVTFSPADYYDSIPAWIIPLFCNSKHESELFLNIGKLVRLRTNSNTKLIRPVPYSDSSINSRIVEQVSNLLKNRSCKNTL